MTMEKPKQTAAAGRMAEMDDERLAEYGLAGLNQEDLDEILYGDDDRD